jgi:hypothetical protein
MDNDKETEKTEETKLRDLTPEKDAKGGIGALPSPDRPRQDIQRTNSIQAQSVSPKQSLD